MPIIKVNRTRDYTVMSNYHFREKGMTLKAKGLLSEMLSLPDGWNYSVNGLIELNKDNETSVKSALQELKDFKYLTVTKLNPDQTQSGKYEYVYNIYEFPYDEQEGDFLGVENLPLYKINNKRNNNISNDILFKEKKSLEDEIEELKKELEALKKKKKREPKPFTKPTVEEIAEYCLERQNNINPKKFFTFYDVADWKDTNLLIQRNMQLWKPIKNWKQKVITWEKDEQQTEAKKQNIPGWVGKEIAEIMASEEEIKALEELLDNDGLRNRKTN